MTLASRRLRNALALVAAAALAACGGASTADETGTSGDAVAAAAKGAPYPIVLMHGMAGFDKLKKLPLDVEYFGGIVKDLGTIGEREVFITIAEPYDTSEHRAAEVATQIDAILKKTHRKKVNLVGHSQGGLDARILARPAGLGYGDRIASVTTIATPHHGTKLADAVADVIDLPPESIVDPVLDGAVSLLKSLYVDDDAPHLRQQVDEISHKHMDEVFNPTYVDDPRVAYATYGGRTDFDPGIKDCGDAEEKNAWTEIDVPNPLFLATTPFLAGLELSSNDGLVSVKSSRWGTFVSCVPADHLKETGIFPEGPQPLSHFDHLAFFRGLIARLRAQGF